MVETFEKTPVPFIWRCGHADIGYVAPGGSAYGIHVVAQASDCSRCRDGEVSGDEGKAVLVRGIPAGIWTSARSRALEEGVSVGAVVTKALRSYLVPTNG